MPSGAPEPDSFPWPDWTPVPKRDEWVRRVNDGAFALVEVRSSCAYLDGIRQALAQEVAPPPNEGDIERVIRETQLDPVPKVLRWLTGLEGRGGGAVTAALRAGPKAAAWRHPRLAADQQRSSADRRRREARRA